MGLKADTPPLAAIARQLNQRPRKTLGYKSRQSVLEACAEPNEQLRSGFARQFNSESSDERIRLGDPRQTRDAPAPPAVQLQADAAEAKQHHRPGAWLGHS